MEEHGGYGYGYGYGCGYGLYGGIFIIEYFTYFTVNSSYSMVYSMYNTHTLTNSVMNMARWASRGRSTLSRAKDRIESAECRVDQTRDQTRAGHFDQLCSNRKRVVELVRQVK